MAKIIPTIGRQVWFYPAKGDIEAGIDYRGQPLAATVVYVKNELFINLLVLDAAGDGWKFEDVVLFPEERPWDFNERCAQWMPYQRQQAGLLSYTDGEKSQGNSNCHPYLARV